MHMEKTLSKRYIILGIAIAVFIAVVFIPLSESILNNDGVKLTQVGRMALGILCFSLVLWMTEAIPFHITGLFSIVLMAILKIGGYTDIVKLGFGSDTITFFIGVLILSACITKSGFSKRISMLILSRTGNNTKMIILGFIVVGVIISMWVTDMAVAAMMLPLAKAILDEEGIKPLKSNFGRALMITCVWGPLIGGIATPAGCGPNPLAMGFIKEMTGYEITFLEWMKYGVPSALLLILPAWLILITVLKPEITHLKRTKEDMKQEFKNMPPMGKNERSTIILFFITVVLWLLSSKLSSWLGISIPIAMPVVLTSCLFFFPGVTDFKWKDIEPEISWSGIILIATGISLGMMLYSSGAAEWISVSLLGSIVSLHPLLQIFAVVLIVSFLKVAFSSNTVCASIIIPLVVALATRYNVAVLPIAIPASLTLSMAFILITSSPTNVIPYSAGYFSISDFAKSGLIMTAVYSVMLAVIIYAIGLMSGLYLV